MNTDWLFTAEKITQRLALIRPYRFRQRQAIKPFAFFELHSAEQEPALSTDTDHLPRIPYKSYWGSPDLNFVLYNEIRIPDDWDGSPALYLPLGVAGDIFTHPEALLYLDGEPIASADRYHHLIPLPDSVSDGQSHAIALHGWTGLSGWPPDPTSTQPLYMDTCELVLRDRMTEEIICLVDAALQTVKALPANRAEVHDIVACLDRTFLKLDTRDPIGDDFYRSVPDALEELKSGLEQSGVPQEVNLHAIGHAHMDVAYLWPVSQTRRKMARTTANVLRLAQQYPDYRFSNSQAALYALLQKDYPGLFEGVRQAVDRGQWELMGGMWVEPDVNIAGAEALVRQLVLSRRYFRQWFGDTETPILWLPDSFGFSACLPQLALSAGLKWFCTNKLNWNQLNRMPCCTFWWQGLDGSKILSHVLTTPREVRHLPFPTNYKSDLSAGEVLGTWENSTSKEFIRDIPICFGYGDGGGGPTEDLIRLAKAYEAMPGMPRLKMSTLAECFSAMETQAHDLPVWSGELYMEGHRGVFTSNGWIKRRNRKAEHLLHETEALAVIHQLSIDLQAAWERLCLNQFHDIVTGTSIREVFDAAARDYQFIEQACEQALHSLAPGSTIVHNSSPYAQSPLVFTGQQWLQMPSIAPYSSLHIKRAVPAQEGLHIYQSEDTWVLENRELQVHVNRAGQLATVKDKTHDRRVLAGAGNVLQSFEDRPIAWDAWDIDPFFEDRPQVHNDEAEIRVVENGPYRVALQTQRTIGASLITQTIRLSASSRRIDFVTEIDWHETHTLLKVAFPVNVHSPRASYDVQWGFIERPTHRNTTWDKARFEVCAHQWADLSDSGYGVALLNDCKYGYDIRDNIIRLSLIKSATMPDVDADQGHHRFTYALLPHSGSWQGVVDPEAAALNHGYRLTGGNEAPPPVQSECANVIIETLKPADDGVGFVMRLYESHRMQSNCRIRIPDWVQQVFICNLLEETQSELAVEQSCVYLELSAFEIVTLRCV